MHPHLKKNTFFGLGFLIMMTACGGPRVAVVTTANTGSTPPPTPAGVAASENLAIGEGQTNGPFLPPAIAPTVYAPYIRRAETPGPALPVPENQCHLAVEVRNYDGVDGCGILLETDEGTLLLVGTTPRGEPLEAGTRISIGYEYMKDYDGPNCGNADAVIRITCKRLLRISSGLPRPIVCEAYDKPSQWLYDLAKGYSATYITRFPWDEDRFVYLLESPFGQYLYDCRGYLICQPRKNCLGFVKDFDKGVVIYEG